MARYLITTPIFYVNARPHIGHVYSAVLADSLARFHRLNGAVQVRLSTGTDEHGNKILDAAKEAGRPPTLFCDHVSQTFRNAFSKVNVAADEFIRTTGERHRHAVERFWKTLRKGKQIYLGEHSGWYCRSDECFVPSGQVEEDQYGVMVARGTTKRVEWVSEPNYRFKLSEFKDPLRGWLKDIDPIRPIQYQQDMLKLLDGDLQDISVSRLASNAPWGISVPNDPTHTIYVWLDALVSYLTAAGYPGKMDPWPPIQIIGKDIVKFHCLYWPAFLMAAGLDPPMQIISHGHWKMSGMKMSKSIGNVIGVDELVESLGGDDAARYFMLRHASVDHDLDFDIDVAIRCVNHDLADQLGNLYARALPLLPSDLNETTIRDLIASASVEPDLKLAMRTLPDLVATHYTKADFHRGLQTIAEMIALANQWFSKCAPWSSACPQDQRGSVAVQIMECCRVAGILLQPVVPDLAARLLTHLGVPAAHRTFSDCSSGWQGDGPQCRAKFSLFQRLPEKPRRKTTGAAAG
ncbi:methionine--tRNA ligase [Plasmodiophora brassicae]